MRRAGVEIICVCVALGCGGAETGSSGPDGVAAGDSAVGFDLGIDLGVDAVLPETLPDGRACPALDIKPPNAIIFIAPRRRRRPRPPRPTWS